MSLRRQVRLRKEFLLKKHQEAQEQVRDAKKRKLQEAVDENRAIPTELANEARSLHHEAQLDVNAAGERQAIDDEYANVGSYEPKICVTTSRDPSSRLKQFAKEIKLCVPNSQVVNRGNHRTDELVDACRKADFTDIMILTETRGMPDGLSISHLPFGPTIYFTLSNCVLRHDIADCTHASQAYPHLIFEAFDSKIGARVSRILQSLYPVPKEESKRVITFANSNDHISFRHHMYSKDGREVVLKEAGPRFEMLPYEIRLGTVDMKEAEKEWVFRPYLNTSRKKQAL